MIDFAKLRELYPHAVVNGVLHLDRIDWEEYSARNTKKDMRETNLEYSLDKMGAAL